MKKWSEIPRYKNEADVQFNLNKALNLIPTSSETIYGDFKLHEIIKQRLQFNNSDHLVINENHKLTWSSWGRFFIRKYFFDFFLYFSHYFNSPQHNEQ